MHFVAARCWLVLVGCALAIGCAGNDQQLVNISGKATYRGKAVPGGTILLQPGSGRAFVAAIDETGRYAASVPVGNYKVAVVSSTAIPEGTDVWKANTKFSSPMVPDKFGRPETSGTNITVTSEDGEKPIIDINLL